MTYLALSAGYRGLGFQGDADLTRARRPGRALWIEMSFLNLEIDLCEQILAENDKPIPIYNVFDPEPLPIPSNATQLPSREAGRGNRSLRPAAICRRGRGACATARERSCSSATTPGTPVSAGARWPRTSS